MLKSGNRSNPAQVVRINNKSFVVGLFWQPLRSLSGAKKEAVIIANREGLNHMVIYSSSMIQVGLADVPTDKIKEYKGSYSLACVLAEELKNKGVVTWVGAFVLDKYSSIMVAVRDGAIIPGCDVIGTHDEISASLQNVIHMHPWDRVYVSGTELFGISGDIDSNILVEEPLSSLVTKKKYPSAYRLTPTKVGISPKFIGFLGGLIFLGGAAYGALMYFDALQAQKDLLDSLVNKQEHEARLQARRAQLLKEVEASAPIPPWFAKPQPHLVLEACVDAIHGVEPYIAGWRVTKLNCNYPSGLDVDLVITQGATMRDFRNEAMRLKSLGIIRDYIVNPESGSISIELPQIESRGETGAEDKQEWLIGWVSHFQSLIIGSQITPEEVPASTPISLEAIELLGERPATPDNPWWGRYTWSFESGYLTPLDILSAPLPKGFVVDSVTLEDSESDERRWSATGEMYVQE